MLILILGLILFLGSHLISSAKGSRAQLIERLGLNGYRIAFSVVSLISLAILIYGFGRYRDEGMIQIWNPPVFTRHLALLLVWCAWVALAAAYFPGRIKRALKHPMLVAVKFWALAHLLANGDLGGMLLFGSFLAWAVIARIMAKRRDEVVDHGGPVVPPSGWRGDLAALVVGTAAYLIFLLWLHPLLIGVTVVPV